MHPDLVKLVTIAAYIKGVEGIFRRQIDDRNIPAQQFRDQTGYYTHVDLGSMRLLTGVTHTGLQLDVHVWPAGRLPRDEPENEGFGIRSTNGGHTWRLLLGDHVHNPPEGEEAYFSMVRAILHHLAPFHHDFRLLPHFDHDLHILPVIETLVDAFADAFAPQPS